MSVAELSTALAPGFNVKDVDSVGRVRAYGDGLIPADAFLATCNNLERRCLAVGASRWAVRALVPRGVNVAPPSLELGANGAALEVNRLSVEVDNTLLDYLWVARNLQDRGPSPDEISNFEATTNRMVDYQRNYIANFNDRTDKLLTLLEERKLGLVCHDPTGHWGQRLVDPAVFTSALQQLFYCNKRDAAAMVRGRGYSPHGHYVFGLENEARQLLAMFVLAQFDWGFEGTYTMVNSTLSPRLTSGAARVLMLLSNALVLSRHGSTTLLYGEANVHNMKACISAGYEVIPPKLAPGVHQNVVWRDNPIGMLTNTDSHLSVTPPHYRNEPYVDYALMRARNELLTPYIPVAQRCLRA